MSSAWEFTPFDEVEQHRHPILPDSERYRLVRAHYDIRYDGGDSNVTLYLQHQETAETRCLLFAGATLRHPISEVHGLYILDIRYRGWELSVEVGEYFEDGGVFFHARSVRDITSQTDEPHRVA